MKILRLVLLVAVAPIFLIQGCDSASNEPLPNGGTSLCINLYETCIDLILQNPISTGSSCLNCHILPNGASGGFGLNPGAVIGSPEMMMNFTTVEARTLNNGLLLSKAIGNSHGGGIQLKVGDLCYNTIAEWRSIVAPTDGSACTATISTCGLINPTTILSCGL